MYKNIHLPTMASTLLIVILAIVIYKIYRHYSDEKSKSVKGLNSNVWS